MLPDSVAEEVSEALKVYPPSGVSIASLSHRSGLFTQLAERIDVRMRKLLAIPSTHHVLLLQGGATFQFGMIPQNLLRRYQRAYYINTGIWSTKACVEAKRFGQIVAIDARKETDYLQDWSSFKEADYLHYTPNETIDGFEMLSKPQCVLPVVADFSSSIMSCPIDVAEYGLIYAGAQKNLGPAGLVVVIIHEDLIHECPSHVPTLCQYVEHLKSKSLYNTPPTVAWLMLERMLAWVEQEGGLDEMGRRNKAKALKMYDYLDQSDFYNNSVPQAYRSRMNIPFSLAESGMDKLFLEQAEGHGLVGLKGHRLVGGMRASFYNAMSYEGVLALIDFMEAFKTKYG